MKLTRLNLAIVMLFCALVITVVLTVSFLYTGGTHDWAYDYDSTAGEKCTQCHVNIETEILSMPAGSPHRALYVANNCSVCHRNATAGFDGNTNHAGILPECTACHLDTEPERDGDGDYGIMNITTATEAHNQMYVDATGSDHDPGKNQACLSCHSQVNTTVTFNRPQWYNYTINDDWTIGTVDTGPIYEGGNYSINFTTPDLGKHYWVDYRDCSGTEGCHQDVDYSRLGGVSGGHHSNADGDHESSEDCLTCHWGEDPTKDYHAAKVVSCTYTGAGCHDSITSTNMTDIFTDIDVTLQKNEKGDLCWGCHAGYDWLDAGAGLTLQVETERNYNVSYWNGAWQQVYPDPAISCQSCHDDTLAAVPPIPAWSGKYVDHDTTGNYAYGGDGSSGCLNCHDEMWKPHDKQHEIQITYNDYLATMGADNNYCDQACHYSVRDWRPSHGAPDDFQDTTQTLMEDAANVFNTFGGKHRSPLVGWFNGECANDCHTEHLYVPTCTDCHDGTMILDHDLPTGTGSPWGAPGMYNVDTIYVDDSLEETITTGVPYAGSYVHTNTDDDVWRIIREENTGAVSSEEVFAAGPQATGGVFVADYSGLAGASPGDTNDPINDANYQTMDETASAGSTTNTYVTSAGSGETVNAGSVASGALSDTETDNDAGRSIDEVDSGQTQNAGSELVGGVYASSANGFGDTSLDDATYHTLTEDLEYDYIDTEAITSGTEVGAFVAADLQDTGANYRTINEEDTGGGGSTDLVANSDFTGNDNGWTHSVVNGYGGGGNTHTVAWTGAVTNDGGTGSIHEHGVGKNGPSTWTSTYDIADVSSGTQYIIYLNETLTTNNLDVGGTNFVNIEIEGPAGTWTNLGDCLSATTLHGWTAWNSGIQVAGASGVLQVRFSGQMDHPNNNGYTHDFYIDNFRFVQLGGGTNYRNVVEYEITNIVSASNYYLTVIADSQGGTDEDYLVEWDASGDNDWQTVGTITGSSGYVTLNQGPADWGAEQPVGGDSFRVRFTDQTQSADANQNTLSIDTIKLLAYESPSLRVGYEFTFSPVPSGTFDLYYDARYTDGSSENMNIFLYDFDAPGWVDMGWGFLGDGSWEAVTQSALGNQYISAGGLVRLRFEDATSDQTDDVQGTLDVDHLYVQTPSANSINVVYQLNENDGDGRTTWTENTYTLYFQARVAGVGAETFDIDYRVDGATWQNFGTISGNSWGGANDLSTTITPVDGEYVEIRILDNGLDDSTTYQIETDYIYLDGDTPAGGNTLRSDYVFDFTATPPGNVDAWINAYYDDADVGDNAWIWAYDFDAPGWVNQTTSLSNGVLGLINLNLGPQYVDDGTGEVYLSFRDEASNDNSNTGTLYIEYMNCSYTAAGAQYDLLVTYALGPVVNGPVNYNLYFYGSSNNTAGEDFTAVYRINAGLDNALASLTSTTDTSANVALGVLNAGDYVFVNITDDDVDDSNQYAARIDYIALVEQSASTPISNAQCQYCHNATAHNPRMVAFTDFVTNYGEDSIDNNFCDQTCHNVADDGVYAGPADHNAAKTTFDTDASAHKLSTTLDGGGDNNVECSDCHVDHDLTASPLNCLSITSCHEVVGAQTDGAIKRQIGGWLGTDHSGMAGDTNADCMASCHDNGPHDPEPSGGACHGNGGNCWNMDTGSHPIHIDTGQIWVDTNPNTFNCSTCHYNAGGTYLSTYDTGEHGDSTVQVYSAVKAADLDTRWGNDGNTPSWDGANCNNVYCHSNGVSADVGPQGGDGWGGAVDETMTYYSPTWGTAFGNCGGCHEGQLLGAITAAADYPNTGEHRKGAHNSNSQGLQVGSGGQEWIDGWVQCFWCHSIDDDNTATAYQGTFGTSQHLNGVVEFDPRNFSVGGTMDTEVGYELGSHCGPGGGTKTCWY